jgi:hypothetical protein
MTVQAESQDIVQLQTFEYELLLTCKIILTEAED